MAVLTRPTEAEPASRGRRRAPRAAARGSGLLYVLPALVVYGMFTLLPALHTLYLSLFEWDGITGATWAGLANYARVFEDPVLRSSIVHALILIVFFSLLPVALAWCSSALLSRQVGRGMTLYRTIFFLPYVLPLVAVGVTWRWMYSDSGVINQVLGAVGLDGLTRAWLGDFNLALPAIGLIGAWTLTGFCMMLFLSGVQRIDPSLYEAAQLDGAGPVREFRPSRFPGCGRDLDRADRHDDRRPGQLRHRLRDDERRAGRAHDRPGLLVYRLAFSDGQVGQACALAVVLTALVILFVAVIRRVSRP